MYAADGRGPVRGKGRRGGFVVQTLEVISFVWISSLWSLKAAAKKIIPRWRSDAPEKKLKTERYQQAPLNFF